MRAVRAAVAEVSAELKPDIVIEFAARRARPGGAVLVALSGGEERRSGPVVAGVDGLVSSEAAVASAFEEASLHGSA